MLYQTLRVEHANIDPFLELHRPNYMYCNSVNLRSETCVKDFTDYINQMLEQGKRGQSVNASWVNARNNLITASVMGEVYKRKKLEPDNLLKTCVDM